MDTRYSIRCSRYFARAVLNACLKDILASANPEVVANLFFSKNGTAEMFCGLADIDKDTFKTKCYELVAIRESELYTKEELKKTGAAQEGNESYCNSCFAKQMQTRKEDEGG